MDQKERYIVELEDGRRINVVESSFQRVIAMFGEENVVKIEKRDFQEATK